MNLMKIGDVAQRSGIGIETIRYYERQGLLDEPERLSSGYRQYDQNVIARLEFIRRAKSLGFTLGEIKELLDLWFEPDTTCCQIRQRADDKIRDIEEKIRSLQQMKRSLRKVVDQCKNRGMLGECPLLEGLVPKNGQT